MHRVPQRGRHDSFSYAVCHHDIGVIRRSAFIPVTDREGEAEAVDAREHGSEVDGANDANEFVLFEALKDNQEQAHNGDGREDKPEFSIDGALNPECPDHSKDSVGYPEKSAVDARIISICDSGLNRVSRHPPRHPYLLSREQHHNYTDESLCLYANFLP